jgi:hypothetical protein
MGLGTELGGRAHRGHAGVGHRAGGGEGAATLAAGHAGPGPGCAGKNRRAGGRAV